MLNSSPDGFCGRLPAPWRLFMKAASVEAVSDSRPAFAESGDPRWSLQFCRRRAESTRERMILVSSVELVPLPDPRFAAPLPIARFVLFSLGAMFHAFAGSPP